MWIINKRQQNSSTETIKYIYTYLYVWIEGPAQKRIVKINMCIYTAPAQPKASWFKPPLPLRQLNCFASHIQSICLPFALWLRERPTQQPQRQVTTTHTSIHAVAEVIPSKHTFLSYFSLVFIYFIYYLRSFAEEFEEIQIIWLPRRKGVKISQKFKFDCTTRKYLYALQNWSNWHNEVKGKNIKALWKTVTLFV